MIKILFNKLHHSLYAKIVIAIVGTVIVVGLLYTALIERMKSGWCREWADKQAEGIAVILHNRLYHRAEPVNFDEMIRFLHFLNVQNQGTKIQVLDSKRAVLFSTGKKYLKHDKDSVIQSIVPLELTWCDDCNGQGMRQAAFVLFEIPQSAVPVLTRSEIRLLEWYTIFAVIMTTCVVLFVVWRVVKRPLSTLMNSIHEIKKGRLDCHCPDLVMDEIGQLAENLNMLLGSVDSKNQELEQLYQVHMEEASRLANIGEMASGLAHEIKTPLHGVIAAMQVLTRRDPDMPHKAIFNQMEYQLHRVVRILDDMLQYARPQKPMFDSCSIESILDKVLSLLQADIEKTAVNVVRSEADNLPLMRLDSEKMQQVFLNLILNAVQACSEGDSIALIVTRSVKSKRVVIQIRDSGPGIPPEVAKQIFVPFFTTKENGNGLGLAITKTIVEQHKGTLELLQDDSPGACFEIRLPILENVQINPEEPDSHASVMDTSTSVTDAYLLSVVHSCDAIANNECSSELMQELAGMTVNERKKRLQDVHPDEKLALQRAHLTCTKHKQKK